jgi:tetratricopeptide (TPR) repeat protein
MSKKVHLFKIFIASPRNLDNERILFNEAIEEYNKNEAFERGVLFKAIAWEETLGAQGRPQDIINEELRQCDFFILILHDWWGSSPKDKKSKYSSGSEEEFHVAYECLKDNKYPMKQMVLFFKDVDPSQLNDPGPQLSQVLAFKRERQELGDFMYRTFTSPESFKKNFIPYLGKWLRIIERKNLKKINVQKKSVDKIKTRFNSDETEWIYRIELFNDWKLAIERAESFQSSGKLLEADLIYNQIGTRCGEPLAIAKSARFYRKCGRLDRAQDYLLRALGLISKDESNEDTAYIHRQLGRVYELQRNWEIAFDNFNQALTIYEKTNNLKGCARTYRDIGLLNNKKGLSTIAIENLDKSIELYESISDLNGCAASLGYLGVIYKDMGFLDKSLNIHEKVLKIYNEMKGQDNEDAISRTKSNIAVIYRMQTNFQDAEKIHREVLKFYSKSNDLRGISQEYSNIGVIKRHLGQLDDAERFHHQALDIAEKMNNERGRSIQLGNLGLDYIEMESYELAKTYIDKSMKISQEINDIRGIAHQLKNLGYWNFKQGDYKESLRYYRESLKIETKINSQYGMALSNKFMGECIIRMKKKSNRQTGINYLKDALSYFQRTKIVKEIDLIEELLK